MKTIVVRYQTKPDRTDENIALVENVFAELNEKNPEGFGYATFVLEDGVSFMHVIVEHDGGNTPLTDFAAFREFVADVTDRCDVPPAPSGARVVGSYNFFAR